MAKIRKYIEESEINHKSIRDVIKQISEEHHKASAGNQSLFVAMINFYDIFDKKTKYLVTNVSEEIIDKIINDE